MTREEQKRPIKTTSNNKMVIRTYIYVITFNCKWTKCSKDIQWI